MRGTECDERRDIEASYANDAQLGKIGRKLEQPGIGVVERWFRLDSGFPDQRHNFAENAALGQRQDQSLVRKHGSNPNLFLIGGTL